jgi:hypothetical protein
MPIAAVLVTVFVGGSYAAEEKRVQYSDRDTPPRQGDSREEPKTSPGGAKMFSSPGMVLDYVGDSFIVANERKFAVTADTVITSRSGTTTYLRLLRLLSVIDINYHKDQQRNFIADSITVTGEK